MKRAVVAMVEENGGDWELVCRFFFIANVMDFCGVEDDKVDVHSHTFVFHCSWILFALSFILSFGALLFKYSNIN